MPVTPIVPNYRLDYTYSFSGLLHRLQFRCDAHFDGTEWKVDHIDSISSRNLSSLTTLLNSKLAGLWAATQVAVSTILYHRVGTVYNQIDIFSNGQPGINTGANQPTVETTYSFRDTAFKLAKIVTLETTDPAPQHVAYSALGAANKVLVDALLHAAPLTDDLGGYYRSRGGNTLSRFLFVTVSLNKRIRRDRNLV